MFNIVVKIAVKTVSKAAKYLAVAGIVHAGLQLITRKLYGAKASPQVEANSIAVDFVEGVWNAIKHDGIFIALTAAVAGAAVVSSSVAAWLFIASMAYLVGKVTWDLYRTVRERRAEVKRYEAIKEETTAKFKKVEEQLAPQPVVQRTQRVDIEVDVDAAIFEKSGKQVRDAGAEWYRENFGARPEVPVRKIKIKVQEALMRVKTPSNKRILFLQGIEDAWTVA